MDLKIRKPADKKGRFGKNAAAEKKFPVWLVPAFTDRGVDPEKFKAYEYMDMDKNGDYADMWLSFDEKNIYIVTGKENISKKRGPGSIDMSYKVTDFEEHAVSDFDSLKIERFVSTARLLGIKKPAEEGGEEKATELARFSLGVANKLERITHAFQLLKEGKDIPPENFDSQTFCPKCGARYPDPNRKVCPRCLDKRSLTVRLLGFLKFYYKQVIIFFMFLLASSVFSVLSPYIGTKMLYDDVLKDSGATLFGNPLYGEVTLVILLIVAVRVLALLLNMAQSYVSALIVPYMTYDLKLRIFAAMQKLSLSFYTSKQTGFLMQRVTNDASNVYWFFVDGVPFLLINVITFAAILIIMMIMNWQLTLFVVAIIPVMVATWRIFGRRFHRMHHNVWTQRAKMVSHLSDTMSGQRVIKAFAKEGEESDRFGTYSGDTMRADVRVSNTADTVFPLLGLITVVSNMIVLAVGGVMIVNGDGAMSFGKLMTFTTYMNMLYSPVNFFSRITNWYARCMDSTQRIFEIIDSEPEVKEIDEPVRLPEMKGDISMKDVMFEYEPGRPIIKGVTLDVKAGHMVGIVGRTGAGKSTIVNLIARLYDVKEGSISIDGVNVKDIAFADMKHNIGIVSQEIYLFIGTIADNIRYSRPDASMEEVIAAAKAASAHDFIMRLPDGYETRVGSGGQDLSGGEKQRLSIARTIIQNPKILILDEATASMDTETERHIQDSLQSLKAGRTTIAIAHRLSTLRDADVLAVIDNGEMKEYGTHEELIKLKGIYYKLYMLQFEALKHIAIAE